MSERYLRPLRNASRPNARRKARFPLIRPLRGLPPGRSGIRVERLMRAASNACARPRKQRNRRSVSALSTIARCQRLAANSAGRDLVVGDLHGHRSLFERVLERMNFDPARDRVLSVGDLIDRGPESLDTLALIEQPWFHAVLGNHELMLLNFLGYYGSRIHNRKSFPSGSGQWVIEAASRSRKRLGRLADRLASLPLAIHVDASVPFNVTHGDLHPLGDSQQNLLDVAGVSVHVADSATTSRRNIGEAMKCGFVDLDFAGQPVQVSDAPFGELPLTYVGHSPLTRVTVHRSYVYVDQRVGERSARRPEDRPPTVLDQTRFSFWLRGVALARKGAEARERVVFPLRTGPSVRVAAARA